MRWQIVFVMGLSLLPALSLAKSTDRTDKKDLIDRVQSINQKVQKAGDSDQIVPCPGCYDYGADSSVPTENKSLIQQCVETLCPDPGFSISKLKKSAFTSGSERSKLFDKELGPIIQEIARLEAEDDIAKNEYLLNWLKTAPKLDAPGPIRVFNFFSTARDFSSFQFKMEGNSIVVDREKSLKNLPKSESQDFDFKVRIINQYLKTYDQTPFPETDPATVRLLFPGEKFKQKVSETIVHIRNTAEKISKDPEYKFLANLEKFKGDTSEDNLKRLFENDEINPETLSEINKIYAMVSFFKGLTDNAVLRKDLLSPPVDIKKFAAEKDIELALRYKMTKARAIKDGKDVFVGGKCRAAFMLAQEALPSKSELDSYKKRWPQLKQNFIEKLKPHLSSHSAGVVAQEMKSWSVSYPLSKEQHLANMKKSLKRSLDNARKLKSQFDSDRKAKDGDVFAAMSVSVVEIDYDLPTDNTCEDLDVSLLPDSALGSRMSIGPMVIRHGSKAEGISYHEMGHLLYWVLNGKEISKETKNWYNSSRICLIENHNEIPKEVRDQGMGGLFLSSLGPPWIYDSEDFADLISSIAVENEENFACSLVRQVDPTLYTDMSMKNENESDSHSSNFFRMLHLSHLKKGSVPGVCQRAMAAKGQDVKFKNCLSTAVK